MGSDRRYFPVREDDDEDNMMEFKRLVRRDFRAGKNLASWKPDAQVLESPFHQHTAEA